MSHATSHKLLDLSREMFDNYLINNMALAKKAHLLIESNEFVYTPHDRD